MMPDSINYTEKFSLMNKVIIIAGGCGLIGKAFVEASAQFGASVVVADLSDAAPEVYASELAERFSGRILGVAADVSKRGSVESLLKAALDAFGRIDGLVNCHQFKPPRFFTRFEEYSDEDWDDVVEVNLKGTFLSCQIIGGWMAEHGGGCIVNMPSVYSVVAPNQNLYKGTNMGCPAAYSASKGGVQALSQYLATYWAPKGIRVNMITPHGVWNNHEVANALIYLLSDASSFVTGHNLVVDGGWTAW